MSPPSSFYDHQYGHAATDVYADVRRDVYGDDLGQASWLTVDEARRWFDLLVLAGGRRALEVACGSGGLTCALSRASGATCVGIDVNPRAIEAAQLRAAHMGLEAQVGFHVADAGEPLPFEDSAFDAILCNDSINHLPDRPQVFRDWRRLLRPHGLLLFTDPIVVTGQLTSDEIAVRSSIGFFVWTPVGQNESLLERAGFTVLHVEDLTEAVASVASSWVEARERRRRRLAGLEGDDSFDAFQRFLRAAHLLSVEHRLSRFLYLARKDHPGP